VIIHGTWQNELPKIQDKSVDLMIIDPPYLTTKESWDKEEVVNSELSSQLFRIAKDSCSLYVWCGIGEKSQSLIRWFPIFNQDWFFKDLVTWKKQRGIGMRKGWLYTREEIMWFVKDNKNFIWNVENQYSEEKRAYDIIIKGKGSIHKNPFKRITNVWTDVFETIYGTSPRKSSEISKAKFHFTKKPLKAIKRIILAHTKEGDTVLDCFLGSGTTMQACKELNRKCIGIEKEKKYFDMAMKLVGSE